MPVTPAVVAACMDAQPTLVVLPGLDGTRLLTTPLLDALAARGVPAQVLRYPQDGPQDYATLAARTRLQLPQTPFVLLGESFAGPLAVLLAAQAPPALRGVVLSTTFAHRPVPVPAAFANLLAPAWPLPPLAVLVPLLLGRWCTAETRHALEMALNEVPANVLRQRAAATLRVDARKPLRSLQVPLLGLLARHDRLLWPISVQALQRLAPQARWVTLDGPHLLLQARADAAAGVIADWLRGYVAHKAIAQQS